LLDVHTRDSRITEGKIVTEFHNFIFLFVERRLMGWHFESSGAQK